MVTVAEFSRVSYDIFLESAKNTFLSSLSEEEIRDIYDDLKMPTISTPGSAGHDFFMPADRDILPGETIIVPTGFRCRIDDGWALFILPRSGLGFKYGLQLDNTVGLIDSDYYYSYNEGHIMAKITNHSKDKICSLKRGQGFVQGVFLNYGISANSKSNIQNLNKRNGGFGSTDKK